MPSPIAHIAVGLAIGVMAKRFTKSTVEKSPRKVFKIDNYPFIFLAILASVLPDFDVIAGWLTGDFGKYHNNLSHSFLFGCGICLLFAPMLSIFIRIPNKVIFVILFSAYSLHILMDAAAVTRGVMLLWPITDYRFVSPLPIFYGVRWSEGLFAWQHLITIFSELVFATSLCVVCKALSQKSDRGL